MINKDYNKAYSEIREVLKKTDEELVEKIPKSFKKFIEENYDKEYKTPIIDTNKKLDEQNLLDETITILSLIYRNYWCNEEQRKKYDEIISNNEKILQDEIREKYNPDNIFKKNNEMYLKEVEKNDYSIQQQSLVIYKESFIKKIWLKLKNLFVKDKNS